MCDYQGQFSKNLNIFEGPKKWYPPKKFKIFWFLNQVNIYLGKVNQYRGMLFTELGGNQDFQKGWWNPPPPAPQWGLGLKYKQ